MSPGDETMTDPVTIAELDDSEGRVYVFGVNAKSLTGDELSDFNETLERTFDNAGWLVVGAPIQGSVEIVEMTKEAARELIDYGNLAGGIDDD